MKSKFYYRARDARTGRFVSLAYAAEHPETTVRERVLRKAKA